MEGQYTTVKKCTMLWRCDLFTKRKHILKIELTH